MNKGKERHSLFQSYFIMKASRVLCFTFLGYVHTPHLLLFLSILFLCPWKSGKTNRKANWGFEVVEHHFQYHDLKISRNGLFLSYWDPNPPCQGDGFQVIRGCELLSITLALGASRVGNQPGLGLFRRRQNRTSSISPKRPPENPLSTKMALGRNVQGLSCSDLCEQVHLWPYLKKSLQE